MLISEMNYVSKITLFFIGAYIRYHKHQHRRQLFFLSSLGLLTQIKLKKVMEYGWHIWLVTQNTVL